MASSTGGLIPPGARSFGKYELLARLAAGGMAEIFLARPREAKDDGRVVVIKRILPHLAEDQRFVAMFRDEARLASRIEHENACRVIELGNVGDTYFIAMEYLHGVPLSRLLLRAARTKQSLDIPMIASIIAQSCYGLHHAHELRSHDGRLLDVVHRDVSPPNIFVTSDGYVKLLDFGVAKARGASQRTRTGTVKGKNAYMSPEQVLGEHIDRRSDLFSLGIVMWESLTASRLFLRDTDFETFRSITKDDVPDVRDKRRDAPDAVVAVLNKALAKDREQRFADASAMAEAVLQSVAEQGASSHEDLAAYVRAHFGKELASRDELVAQATGSARTGAPGGLPTSVTAPLLNPARTPTKAVQREVSGEIALLGRAATIPDRPAPPPSSDDGGELAEYHDDDAATTVRPPRAESPAAMESHTPTPTRTVVPDLGDRGSRLWILGGAIAILALVLAAVYRWLM